MKISDKELELIWENLSLGLTDLKELIEKSMLEEFKETEFLTACVVEFPEINASTMIYPVKKPTAASKKAPRKALDITGRSLLIPDAHVRPGQDLERFDAVGQLIVDKRPDVIFQMGDFSSMSSLSHWDRNKKLTLEGKRYKEDVKTAKEAKERILAPLKKLQKRQEEAGEDIYAPELIWIFGNHCDWVRQYTIYNPAMDGVLDLAEDLELEADGWIMVPFRKHIERFGVIFTHVPMNGANIPVSGRAAVHKAQDTCSKSQIFAHTHRWEMASFRRHGDEDIMQTLSCGVFCDEIEDYADGAPLGWWAGVTLLNHWKAGRYDVEQISLNRLLEMY